MCRFFGAGYRDCGGVVSFSSFVSRKISRLKKARIDNTLAAGNKSTYCVMRHGQTTRTRHTLWNLSSSRSYPYNRVTIITKVRGYGLFCVNVSVSHGFSFQLSIHAAEFLSITGSFFTASVSLYLLPLSYLS